MRFLILRLRSLFRRKHVEQELDEEIQFHLERQIQEHISRGLTPAEARHAAMRAFDGVEQRKEECRDMRRTSLIDNLLKDLRYARRMMWSSPGFTITAILTIALGIGVNTTLFSAYNAVTLKPLPVADPGSVLRVKRWFERNHGELQYLFSYPEYVYARDHNDVFTGLVAASWPVPVIASIPDNANSTSEESEKLDGQLVSANYFSTLGINAELGRTFLPDEKGAAANSVVVLSHAFWERRFHGDPMAVGKIIRTKDTILTVIGIAPKEFTGTPVMRIVPQVPDFWALISMQAVLVPGRDWLHEPDDLELQMLGRLKPSATVQSARAEIDGLMRQFAPTYTPREKTTSVTVEHTSFLGFTDDLRFMALVAAMTILVGLVLLAACANIANMLLARGVTRRREIGIRLAIGASRGRIIRQLLTESLLLSLLGGLAGLLLSAWTSVLLWTAIKQIFVGPATESIVDLNFSPDIRVFSYALLLSVITGIVFGLSPALQATNSDLISAAKGEGTLFGQRAHPSRLREFLITAQVTISMLFLVGAGLLLHGALRSRGTGVGFQAGKVFTLTADFGNDVKAFARQERLIEALQALPELRNAARGHVPMFRTWISPLTVSGSNASSQPLKDYTLASFASDTYFDTLGIPIIRGRTFTKKEAEEGASVAVLSEATARRFWPGQDPIARRFKLDATFRGELWEFEVIGVVKDIRFANPTRIDPAHVYLATGTVTRGSVLNAVLFRVRNNSPAALASVRKTVQSLDVNLLPNLSMISLEDGPLKFQQSLHQGATGFVVILSCIALMIAGTGIYSVMSHLVSQRVKEIGIRVALGATPRGILRSVVLPGLRPVYLGLLLGVAGGLGLSLVLHVMLVLPESSDFFYGVPFYDPLTFVGLSLFVAAIAAMASFVPARRALSVDPMVALREE